MDALAWMGSLGLMCAHGFFVATAHALGRISPARVQHLQAQRRPGSVALAYVVDNLERFVPVLQLGMVTSTLVLGWLAIPGLVTLLHTPFGDIAAAPEVTTALYAIAFLLLALIHAVLGRLTPRRMGLTHTDAVALGSAWILRVLRATAYPWVVATETIARALSTVLGLGSTAVTTAKQNIDSEDINGVLSYAGEAGLLSPERSDLLRKALTLSTKSAGHLMVPRNEVIYLDINAPLDENLVRATDSRRTRFPLCNRELDDVLGVVDIRPVLFDCGRHEGPHNSQDLTRYAAPPTYFPEVMSGERLWSEFRLRRIQMAVIVDEYGGAAGIVTPADVVAAVMGELEEEAEDDVVELPGGAFDVEGTAPLEEVEEALQVDLGTRDTRTIAGFLMERLGRMPRVGDSINAAGLSFSVLDVNGPRVGKVRIVREGGMRVAAAPTNS